MIDTYRTFEELATHVTEGKDFRIAMRKMNDPILIMAIHGGAIEPLTSELALSTAGDDHSWYLFEGLRESRNEELHIGSEYFDEPQAKDMVRGAEVVVSVHGHPDTEHEFVMIGGLHVELAGKITEHLRGVDITILPGDSLAHSESPQNICNQGMSGGGVEIKVSKKLRDALKEDAGLYRLFTNAIRHAIAAYRII